jgi:hypothetical protein
MSSVGHEHVTATSYPIARASARASERTADPALPPRVLSPTLRGELAARL